MQGNHETRSDIKQYGWDNQTEQSCGKYKGNRDKYPIPYDLNGLTVVVIVEIVKIMHTHNPGHIHGYLFSLYRFQYYNLVKHILVNIL